MFRFTIRDMLWLTVVVALGVAWWIERRDSLNQATQWAPKKESWDAERAGG
jgi:hypothetical protein